MFDFGKPFLLCVDDDVDILEQLKVFLGDKYNIITATSGTEALQALQKLQPDIILMDVLMPGMDGYQVCAQLQENPNTAWIPIIFISALGDEQDRARAFSAGAVDYLVKPVNRHTVRELVEVHQRTGKRWQKTRQVVDNIVKQPMKSASSVQEFICNALKLEVKSRQQMMAAHDSDIYKVTASLGLKEIDVAAAIADYKKLPFMDFINPDSISLGALPTPFSRANNVVVIKLEGQDTLVLSNPFDMILQDSLEAVLDPHVLETATITDPGNIAMLFEKEPAPYIAERIILLAIRKSAKEIHIEAGESRYAVQLLINGNSSGVTELKRDLGIRLVSRFKVLAGIAATSRSRGHDGYYTQRIQGEVYSIRLAVTNTVHGDSLSIQVGE